MRILIAGATGDTGSQLTHILAKSGHSPVAMVRESSDTSVLPDGCETTQADLSDLRRDVTDGMAAVVFAAGSGGDTGEDMTDKIDRDGAKALIDASVRSGVAHFVMLSSVGAGTPEKGPDEMRHYLNAKHAADEYLKGSGLTYTIVRPVALTDDGGTGQIELSTGQVNGDGISRADVAAVLARALDESAARNAIFQCAKGDVAINHALGSL